MLSRKMLFRPGVISLFTVFAAMIFSRPASAYTPQKEKFNTSVFLFQPNLGQLHDEHWKPLPEIKYYAQDKGVNVYFKTSELDFVFVKTTAVVVPDRIKTHSPDVIKQTFDARRVEMHLAGANLNLNAVIMPGDKQAYYSNYFSGSLPNGLLHVSSYKMLTYKNIYPGIDMEVRIRESGIKYSFIIHPGGNPMDIRMDWKGNSSIKELLDGGIKYDNENGWLTESKPVVFLDDAPAKHIPSNFSLNGNTVNFNIDQYNPSKTLVIDPGLTWGTYYGGSSTENGNDNTMDDSDNVYIAGYTASSTGIATKGAFQTTIGSGNDGYLAKFDSSGQLKWGTYYGDLGTDAFWGLATDDSSYIYAFGKTSSSGLASSGAYQTTLAGSDDHILVKFKQSGARVWATYFGGSAQENVVKGCTDNKGNVFLCGETFSSSGIATTGAYQTTYVGSGSYPDAYLAKFNRKGALQWATYYGGSAYDQFYAAACDKNGNIYLKGWTQSTSGISTSTGYQTSYGGGGGDPFLVKFNTKGSLKWGTYYGGSGDEGDGSLNGQLGTDGDVGVDDSGNVYLITNSNSSGMASTNAYQTSVSGDYDILLAKFDSLGSRKWATYYGGSAFDFGKEVVIDETGVYFAGETKSSGGISTTGSYQSSLGGAVDAYIVKLTHGGKRLWATYYGGSSNDYTGGIIMSGYGEVYLTGTTASSSGISKNGYQSSLSGGNDAFLIKFLDSAINQGCKVRTRITKNTAFSGTFSSGTKLLPDAICPGGTAAYNIKTTFPDSTYNSYWKVTSFTVKNLKGTASKDTSFVRPSKTVKGVLKFFPPSTTTADTFILTMNFKADTCSLIYTRYIAVTSTPKAGFTATNSCLGTSPKFTNSSTIATGKMHYLWYFGDGQTSVKDTPTHIYAKGGTYTVSLLAMTDGCKDSIAKSLTIYPPMTGAALVKGKPFQGTMAKGDINDPDRLCNGDTVRYELTPPSAVTNSGYGTTWTIRALTFRDLHGFLTTDTVTTKPTSTKNMTFTYYPKNMTKNDTFLLTIVLRTLSGNCDTVLNRYILVGARPKPKFGFTKVCVGKSTDFIDSSVSVGLSDYLYDFGDGSTSTFHNPSHQYATAGTYTVKLTLTSLSGCSDTYTQKVTVYGPPVLRFGALSPCSGSAAQFIDSTSSTSGQTVTAWVWDFGDPGSGTTNNTSKLASPTHVYKTAGTYTVKLTVTLNTGCTASGTRTIIVQTKPVASYTYTLACPDKDIIFTNTTTNSTGLTYKWYFGDGQSVTTKDATHRYLNVQAYNVSLVAMSSSGCRDSITKVITPYSGPKVKFGAGSACLGKDVTFIDSTPSPAPGVIVQSRFWDFGDGKTASSTVNTITHRYAIAGSYYVKLVATTNQGCKDSLAQFVTIYDKPFANFSLTATCPDKPVTFSDKSNNPTGKPLTYSWDFGDGSAFSTIQNPSKNYVAGTYTVKLKVTNENGCTDDTSISFSMPASPPPSFTGKIILSSSTQKKIQFLVTDPTNYTIMDWNFNDPSTKDSVASGSDVSHIFKTGKSYRVKLVTITTAGCKSEKDTVIDLTTGIRKDVSGSDMVDVFPNPFETTLTIRYTLEKAAATKLEVYDIDGRLVEVLVNDKQVAGLHSYTFDASKSGSNAGIYLIKLTVGNDVYSTKVTHLK